MGLTTLPDRLLIAAEILEGIGGQSAMASTVREAAAALSGRSPSYDALLIIAQSVCGALERAGLTDCDDPGEAIDVLREGYEKRIAALSGREAVALLSSIRELLIANDPACLGIDEAADGQPYPIRDEVIAAITRVLTTPQPGDGVVVPREPTEEMRRAGAARWAEGADNCMTVYDERELARCAWAAMIAAAPSAKGA